MPMNHDMPTYTPAKPAAAPLPELPFYSVDRARALRLITKLQSFGKLIWHDDMNLSELLHHASDGHPVLLDFSSSMAGNSAEMAQRVAAAVPHAPIVAVGSTRVEHSADVLCALRAGLNDFIDLDGSAEEAQTVVRRMLDRMPASMTTAPMPACKVHSVALLGVRAGVGTSTLAAHLGVLAQGAFGAACGHERTATSHGGVLLLDLGHPAGDAQLYLDVRGDFFFNDAARNAFRLDQTLARTAFPRHASDLAVLSHSPHAGPRALPDSDVKLLLQRLRSLFELVLIDLGGVDEGDRPSPMLETADDIWLVADQSVGAVFSLDVTLRRLQQQGIPRDKLRLVINRYIDVDGLSPQQLADRFELPLLAVIPERTRALRESAGVGKLLHETERNDRYVRALWPLLANLSSNPSVIGHDRHHSRLHRLIDMLGVHRWT